MALLLLTACDDKQSPKASTGSESGLQRAQQLLTQAKPRAALQELDKALETDPKVPELVVAAQVHATLGEWESARKYLERAQKIEPEHPAVRLGLADAALGLGKLTLAEQQFGEIAAKPGASLGAQLANAAFASSKSDVTQRIQQIQGWQSQPKFGEAAELELLLGALYQRAGDGESARKAFERGAAMTPASPAVAARLGRILLQRGQLEGAEYLLGSAARSNSVGPVLWLRVSRLALEAGRTEKAEGAFEQARQSQKKIGGGAVDAFEGQLLAMRIDLARERVAEAKKRLQALEKALEGSDDPKDKKALRRDRLRYWQARTLLAQDKRDEANELLRAIPQDSKVYPPARELTAELQAQGDDKEGAKQALLELVKSDRASASAYRHLASLQAKSGDKELAEKTLQQGLDKHRNDVELWVALGKYYHSADQPVRALSALEQAQQRNSQHPDALAYSAKLRWRLGEIDKATELYERLLQVQPGLVLALNNLAYLYAESGTKLDEALSLAKAAQEREPDNPGIADTLGWVHLKRGELDEAQTWLEKSAAALPNDPQVQFHLGMLFVEKGNKAKGHAALRNALALSPDFDHARTARAVLEAAN